MLATDKLQTLLGVGTLVGALVLVVKLIHVPRER